MPGYCIVIIRERSVLRQEAIGKSKVIRQKKKEEKEKSLRSPPAKGYGSQRLES